MWCALFGNIHKIEFLLCYITSSVLFEKVRQYHNHYELLLEVVYASSKVGTSKDHNEQYHCQPRHSGKEDERVKAEIDGKKSNRYDYL